MPRNVQGWLKPEALKSGLSDVWAAFDDAVRLRWNATAGQYVVMHTHKLSGFGEVTDYFYFDTVWPARRKFRRIVRRLGGRA